MNEEEEQAQHTKCLEQLVKARTDQLQATVREIHQLLEALRQIQDMESLEQVQELAQQCISKFAPAPTESPMFGGAAGEPVPEVDPEDLKAVWLIGNEAQDRKPGAKVAIGDVVMRHACKSGANVEATWYRSSLIWLLEQLAQPRLAPWLSAENGFADHPVFRTIASMPVEWIGQGVREDFPFDVDEFFRRLRERETERC